MPLQLIHLDLHGRSAAAQARRAARIHLEETAADHHELIPPLALDTALLLISELVTNAVRHTSGGCLLEVRLAADGIDIEVTDTSDAEPPGGPTGAARADGDGTWSTGWGPTWGSATMRREARRSTSASRVEGLTPAARAAYARPAGRRSAVAAVAAPAVVADVGQVTGRARSTRAGCWPPPVASTRTSPPLLISARTMPVASS